MWVRGLKLYVQGCYRRYQRVASYVGAWIETLSTLRIKSNFSTSHPMWVRGLKPAGLEVVPAGA